MLFTSFHSFHYHFNLVKKYSYIVIFQQCSTFSIDNDPDHHGCKWKNEPLALLFSLNFMLCKNFSLSTIPSSSSIWLVLLSFCQQKRLSCKRGHRDGNVRNLKRMLIYRMSWDLNNDTINDFHYALYQFFFHCWFIRGFFLLMTVFVLLGTMFSDTKVGKEYSV